MLKILEFQDGNKLHITDDLNLFNELNSAGCYVIPEYTNSNRSLNWPHTQYAVENLNELLEISYSKDTLVEGVDFIPDYLKKIYQRLSGIPWNITETKRLIIRETTINDVKEFYKIYSDPSITQFMDPLFENIDDEIAYTEGYIKNIYGFYGYGLWTVVHKDSNTVIGRAGISQIEGEEYPDLGFVIDVNYQNQGYAKEACLEIINYAKYELEFDIIQARIHPHNTKSIKLLENIGFTFPSHTLHQGYLRALRMLS